MAISNFLLGFEEFKTQQQVVDLVLQQEQGQSTEQGNDSAEALLIFQTRTQQTWLVATKSALYCVLDDVAKASTRIQWNIPKEQLVNVAKQSLNVGAQDKNERVGLLQIGDHKNWLYSKKLFANGDPIREISQVVKNQWDEPQASDLGNNVAIGQ